MNNSGCFYTAEKGLEEIKAMRTRMMAESPEMSVLSEEEKNEASVLIESLSAEEKAELANLAGGDYNTMTPLLYKGVSVAEEEQEGAQGACG